jgi:hypothetical protein
MVAWLFGCRLIIQYSIRLYSTRINDKTLPENLAMLMKKRRLVAIGDYTIFYKEKSLILT